MNSLYPALCCSRQKCLGTDSRREVPKCLLHSLLYRWSSLDLQVGKKTSLLLKLIKAQGMIQLSEREKKWQPVSNFCWVHLFIYLFVWSFYLGQREKKCHNLLPQIRALIYCFLVSLSFRKAKEFSPGKRAGSFCIDLNTLLMS